MDCAKCGKRMELLCVKEHNGWLEQWHVCRDCEEIYMRKHLPPYEEYEE